MSTSSAIQVSSRKQSLWERISSSQILASPWVVPTLLVVCVFLLRLPTALFPKELDPDESQALSDAMKFMIDPRPFIAVDGGSWGPLNSYLISIFLLMGFKANFILAHMLATCLMCLQVLTAYVTLRHIGSEKTAALGGVLMVAFYGLATHPNYLNYAGELLPSLLTIAGFYAFVAWLDEDPKRSRGVQLLLLFLAGFALGTAPWCKLQAAPITAGIGLVIVAAIFLAKDTPFNFSRSAVELLAFGWGGVLTTCIMLVTLLACGAVRDFWYSYVQGNAAYAGTLNVDNGLIHVLVMLLMTPLQQFLLVGLCVLVYAALVGGPLVFSKKQAWALSGIFVYTAAALVSVGRAPYPFLHHALFLVPPLTYLAVSVTCCNVNATPEDRHGRSMMIKGALALLLCGTAVLYLSYIVRYVHLVESAHHFAYSYSESTIRVPKATSVTGGVDLSFWARRDSSERIAAVIRGLQKTYPVRSLELWGWAPAVYVLMQTPPATREAIASPVGGPMDYYYRPRFLNDLREHPPDLFVDAVVPDLLKPDWTQSDGYESDPELRKFIEQNYVLVDQLTLVEGTKPVRFFARRAHIHQSP